MTEFTLQFDKTNEMFRGEFKNISRAFIQRMKNKGLLEKVTPEFIEIMPETLDGEVNIDPASDPEDSYWVFFYLKTVATKEMKEPTRAYINQDINFNQDDDTLEFELFISKNSQFIKKTEDETIILSL
jgi:hypothetical protein